MNLEEEMSVDKHNYHNPGVSAFFTVLTAMLLVVMIPVEVVIWRWAF